MASVKIDEVSISLFRIDDNKFRAKVKDKNVESEYIFTKLPNGKYEVNAEINNKLSLSISQGIEYSVERGVL